MTITINNKTLELVEVPDDAYDFEIVERWCELWCKEKQHGVDTYYNGDFSIRKIQLPTGSYRILCKASEATEEQAREILPTKKHPFLNKVYYLDFTEEIVSWLPDYKQAIINLIRSLGMEVETTLILEKLK